MNLLVQSPGWIAMLLAALLVLAAIEDAYRLKISNLICLGVILLAIAAMVVLGLRVELWQNFAIFAAVLGIGTMLFSAGVLGGGDVKLLAGVALWTDFLEALTVLATVFLAGGLLALVILFTRFVTGSKKTNRFAVLRPGGGIPYGIAIAGGTLGVLMVQRL